MRQNLAEFHSPDAALGRARPIGKMGRAVPPSEADSNRRLTCSTVAKPSFVFSISPDIWKKLPLFP